MSDFIDFISNKTLQEFTFTENMDFDFGKKQLIFSETTLQDIEINVSYIPDITSDTPETYVGRLQLAFDFQTRNIIFIGILTSTLDASLTITIDIEYDDDIEALVANIDGVIDNYV